MTGGDVIFNFKGDTNDLEKDTNGLASKVKGIAGGIAKGMTTAVAVGATALTGMVAKSVSAMGDLEQAVGGSEAVFGKYAKTIQDEAEKAYSNAGLSAEEYLSTANKISSLMQGAGIKQSASVDLTTKAMQRASDVASIMGIDTSAAMEAIAGAAKGNFTMMDNLGVAMNATTLEAYALSKGITKSYNEMSNAEKVGLAYEMFLDKTSQYAGNYAKENDTLVGSINTAKKAFTNFLSGTGKIDDVIKAFTNAGKIISESFVKMTPQIVNGLVQLINGLIPQIPTLIQTLLPTVINGAILLIQGLIGAIPQIMTVLLGALPTIIEMLLQGMVQIVTTLAEMLPTLMPQIVEAILSILPILIDNLPLFIQAGFQLITGLLQGIIQSVPKLLSYMPKIISSLLNYWKQLPKMMLDIGVNLVKGLWNGIKNVTGWIKDKIKGFGKTILNGIKGIFGIHSPSTEFEYIGVMNVKGMEKGLEKEKAQLQDTFDSMFDLSPSLYGTSSLNLSPNVNVEVYNSYKQDPLGQMVSDVKTFSGGSKNDYNYGQGV